MPLFYVQNIFDGGLSHLLVDLTKDEGHLFDFFWPSEVFILIYSFPIFYNFSISQPRQERVSVLDGNKYRKGDCHGISKGD